MLFSIVQGGIVDTYTVESISFQPRVILSTCALFSNMIISLWLETTYFFVYFFFTTRFRCCYSCVRLKRCVFCFFVFVCVVHQFLDDKEIQELLSLGEKHMPKTAPDGDVCCFRCLSLL
jgi:hypothetical protein